MDTGFMSEIITSAVSLIVGFIVGQVTVWHRAKVHGHSLIYPAPERTPRAKAWMGLLIGVLAAASVLQGLYLQNLQSRCNTSFREAVVTRSAGSSEQFEALVQLQTDLVEAPSGPAGEGIRDDIRQEYVDKALALKAERQSNPYPDPRC